MGLIAGHQRHVQTDHQLTQTIVDLVRQRRALLVLRLHDLQASLVFELPRLRLECEHLLLRCLQRLEVQRDGDGADELPGTETRRAGDQRRFHLPVRGQET